MTSIHNPMHVRPGKLKSVITTYSVATTVFYLVSLSSCYTLSCTAQDQKAVLSGTVQYQSGAPIAGADVQVQPAGAIGGIVPPPVKTDSMGRFVIVYPQVGEAAISASKLDEGYPDLGLALYGNHAFLSLPKINLTPGLTLTGIHLKLGAPQPVVTFAAVDAQISRPIANARIHIELATNAAAMLSASMATSGTYTLVLPPHSVRVTITAPGYVDWKHTLTATDYPLPKPTGNANRILVPMQAQPH